MRTWLLIAVLLLQPGNALAHAQLLAATPPDGALLTKPPPQFRLRFNEPVAPLTARLIAPDGTATALRPEASGAIVTVEAPALGSGTYVLSWRVVSLDGHPVGGALAFSIGQRGTPLVPGAKNHVVSAFLLVTKILTYLGVYFGIGGRLVCLLAAAPGPVLLNRGIIALLAAGVSATALSIGLQGLDALDLPLAALVQGEVWRVGFTTSYGLTAGLLIAALGGTLVVGAGRAWLFATAAVAVVAVALSGHAGTAAPQLLTRPMIVVHAGCVMILAGVLLAFAAGVGRGQGLRWTARVIPWSLAGLMLSGLVLATVQIRRLDALLSTPYGIVLLGKLAAVGALIGVAAASRLRRSFRPMATVMEIAFVAAIFVAAGLWRFTPPPRVLVATAPQEIHLHGARAMAHITLTAGRGRLHEVALDVLDGEFRELIAREVALVTASPEAGIEPMRRAARHLGGSRWQVDDLPIPVGGRWKVRGELLIDDFDRVALEDEVTLSLRR